MYQLNYNDLEGLAIGAKREIQKSVEKKDSFWAIKGILPKENLLDKVETAAKEAGFPDTLYLDPQEDTYICFSLNSRQDIALFLKSGEEKVERIVLPRPLGYVDYQEPQVGEPENPSEIYHNIIEQKLPLSYGMYTAIRIADLIEKLEDPQEVYNVLTDEIKTAINQTPDEAWKWFTAVAKVWAQTKIGSESKK